VVYEGAHLADHVSVYPRLRVPAVLRVPPGIELTDADDVLKYL